MHPAVNADGAQADTGPNDGPLAAPAPAEFFAAFFVEIPPSGERQASIGCKASWLFNCARVMSFLAIKAKQVWSKPSDAVSYRFSGSSPQLWALLIK
jgi:hypothetical protein